MKWASGIIAAPRPSAESLTKCLASVHANGLGDCLVFAEPGTDVSCVPKSQVIHRPSRIAPLVGNFEPSPAGAFGNFQNWLQCAADLLTQDADVFLIIEDDTVFSLGSVDFVESLLWPDSRCGAVNFYAANVSVLRQKAVPAFLPWPRSGLMGTLAVVFRRECLQQLVSDPEIFNYQRNEIIGGQMSLWDRRAVDTWVGVRLRSLRWLCWTFSRSLVNHHVPRGMYDNSSLGHGASVGKRATLRYVGDTPADLRKLFRMA